MFPVIYSKNQSQSEFGAETKAQKAVRQAREKAAKKERDRLAKLAKDAKAKAAKALKNVIAKTPKTNNTYTPPRNTGIGIGVLPSRIFDNETPPVRAILPEVQAGAKPQSWFAKLLDFGLTQTQIKAQVQIAQAQSGVDQTRALQQVYETQRQQNPNAFENNDRSVGSQTGGALDRALDWIQENILVVGGGALALYLLTRPSPIKGR